MKKPELAFNLISLPLDCIMLALAGVFAFYIRFSFAGLVGPVIYHLELSDFLKVVATILPGLLLIFSFFGLYNLRGNRRFSTEFLKVVSAVSLGLFLIIVAFFFNTQLFPSRFIILASWVLAITFVLVGRVLLKFVQRILFLRGYGLYNVVLINGNNSDSKVIEKVFRDAKAGYRLVAELDYSPQLMEQLLELIKHEHVDEIVQSNAQLNDEINLSLVSFARNRGLHFSFVPNLFEAQRNVVEVQTFSGIPVVNLKNSPLDGWGRVAKKISDIIFSLICIILSSPLFIIISILIKLDSPGKIIYTAKRVGKNNQVFKFYKFRTMYSHLSVGDEYGGKEAENILNEMWQKNDRGGAESPLYKFKNDPRVTKVGRVLRKTKLDELPQFFNVLFGSMSMVGPRAHLVEQVEKYRDTYPRMFSIKPGIFGVTQVAQMSWPELPFEEEIRLDTSYIENWSLLLDIKVLYSSFIKIVFAKFSRDDY